MPTPITHLCFALHCQRNLIDIIVQIQHNTVNRRRSLGHSGRIIFSSSLAPSVGLESSILIGTTGTGKTGFRNRRLSSLKVFAAPQDVTSLLLCMLNPTFNGQRFAFTNGSEPWLIRLRQLFTNRTTVDDTPTRNINILSTTFHDHSTTRRGKRIVN